jgi:hypothetical protein
MYAKLIVALSALAATVSAEFTAEATYFIGDVAVGACADKVKVREYVDLLVPTSSSRFVLFCRT